jgi:hypothetical protein
MRQHKLNIILGIFTLLLCITKIANAASSSSIKFFVSNNMHEIGLEKAYERTTNQFQDNLANGVIDLLQKNHIEQGRFENVLGAYQMMSDKNITGDNTEVFITSPYQLFSDGQIFSIGRQLVKTFQQESVAIFIPSNRSAIADVMVKFTSNKPSITAVVHLIHENLPVYANAFSLHLTNNHSEFNDARVSAIEWLGSKINITEIRKAFPQGAVSYYRGQTYIVNKNDQIESI